MIKDSGERTSFNTGAVRDMHEGKGRFDLLPWHAIHDVAKHCEDGAIKYGERNVDKGIPQHSLVDSAIRHLTKYIHNETDEPHLRAACWNLLWALEQETTHKELIDLPNRAVRKTAYGKEIQKCIEFYLDLYTSTFKDMSKVSNYLNDYLTDFGQVTVEEFVKSYFAICVGTSDRKKLSKEDIDEILNDINSIAPEADLTYTYGWTPDDFKFVGKFKNSDDPFSVETEILLCAPKLINNIIKN